MSSSPELFNDLIRKAAEDAQKVIFRTAELLPDAYEQADLYTSVVFSMMVQIAWVAHKLNGKPFSEYTDMFVREMQAAEAAYKARGDADPA